MEQREGQIGSEGPTMQSPTFREWWLAVVLLPVTLRRLAQGIHRLADEMRYYRQIPQRLAELDEVGRDFNAGLYGFFGGKVSYERSDSVAPNPDLNSVK